jgi:hypothetical protein
MVMFDRGSGSSPHSVGANVQEFTPCKILATNKVVPCITGDGCDGVANDTVELIENGFGIGLLAPWESGGLGVPGLAFGPVSQGAEVIVKVSATDGHPKFAALSEGVDGDKVVGKLNFASSSTAEDVADEYGAFHPSLAILLYPPAQQRELAGGS